MANKATLTFGLAPDIIADFNRVFMHYPEINRVLIFGSRAKGMNKDSSDIDMAVIAPTMDHETFNHLWRAIDDLPLIFKVDLVHWDKLTNERFKYKIQMEGRLFYSREQQSKGSNADSF